MIVITRDCLLMGNAEILYYSWNTADSLSLRHSMFVNGDFDFGHKGIEGGLIRMCEFKSFSSIDNA